MNARRLAQLTPILLLYLVGIIFPYVALARMSFNAYDPMLIFREVWSLENYLKIFTEPYYLGAIFRTLVMGAGVSLVTLILGYPLAWKIARSKPFLKSTLLAAVLSPLLINLVVRTYAWLVVLGDKGVINQGLLAIGLPSLPLMGGWFGVIVGLAHICLPLMVLSLMAVMESLPEQVLEAAENLGASRWTIFSKVVLPLTWSGVGAGVILVFSFAVSAFVTPALLGGGHVATISTLIYEQFTYALNWPFGASLVFVLLAMNFAVLALHGLVFRDER